MKRNIALVSFLFLFTALHAQDEGTAVAQERFARDISVYVTGGPSLTLGKNIGDYKNGINFEIGLNKRSNKVLSYGGSVSYVKFKYDPSVTEDIGGSAFVQDNGGGYWEGYVINLTGGDLSLISVAGNIRLDIIPYNDNLKFAFYGFAKPFVSFSKRTDVYGVSDYYESFDDGVTWDLTESGIDWGPDDYDVLKEESKVTGGIFVGPGIEVMPSKAVSFFAQVAIGYTFPVSIVSTESYDSTLDDYFDDEFPMVTEGFPSINFQFGVSFNF
ncbi:MAG: hypothetical protein WAZ98_13540 [Cyclobacteriaceae bacterium]